MSYQRRHYIEADLNWKEIGLVTETEKGLKLNINKFIELQEDENDYWGAIDLAHEPMNVSIADDNTLYFEVSHGYGARVFAGVSEKHPNVIITHSITTSVPSQQNFVYQNGDIIEESFHVERFD